MKPRDVSHELKQFFAQEVQSDPNATLETAWQHLRSLADSAPGETASGPNAWMQETDELIKKYDVHRPLSDFLSHPPSRAT